MRPPSIPLLPTLATAAVLLSLSACMSAPPPVAPPPMGGPMPPQQLTCNPEAARAAIGKLATPQVVEQARIDAGAGIARVLRPGQVVTMEFRADRLNVDVNERDAITGLRCG